ncbi:hypothetical protein GobsT_44580 [Gemmata obscuriglobus]|nr:hypothetical protein GobsT_44580 [Gemmata obscuriglobus]VTS08977.1 unnamed protein product [Gemmata obscuriglobus UQM 2246]
MSRARRTRAPRGARPAAFTHADHTPTTAARAIMHAVVAEQQAHLHRQDEVRMTTVADGGVRCSAGFGSLTSAPRIRGCPRHRCGHAEHRRPGAPCRRTSEATHHPHSRRRAAPTTDRCWRSATDPNRRVPTRRPPRPTAPRGDEPRPRPPALCGARRAGFTHADHTHTAARALQHARVAERTAHLHRHHRMSGASQARWRCQVQRRVRLAHVRAAHPRKPAHRCGRAEHHRPDAPCRGPPEATHCHPRR